MQFYFAACLIICDLSLRVFAPKMDGVYCMSCRRPDSDFDETRSRRSFGAKTKLETPLSAIQAHGRGLRASKEAKNGPFFTPPKISFLAKFFFSQTVGKCLLWVFHRFLAPKCPAFEIFELS